MNGVFTISLDFELYWGVRDKRTISQYRKNLEGVSSAVREILCTFIEHGVHATWASVGLLFAKDIDEARLKSPKNKPSYIEKKLSPYDYIEADWDKQYDHLHFASSILDEIRNTEGQRIGTHTYSHYYAVEQGQKLNQFDADICSAIDIAKGIKVESLVFPRNQWNTDYLQVLSKYGIHSYRGNESSWIYQASATNKQGFIKRLLRLVDCYINISGHNTTDINAIKCECPYNIPSSRMLRPYSNQLNSLEPLRLRRIKNSMTHAAKRGEIFHLWWHPHNFGVNLKKNMSFLEIVIEHYNYLKENYNMRSLNMEEVAGKIASR